MSKPKSARPSRGRKAAATKSVFETARALAAPPGWKISWTVLLVDKTPGYPVVGYSEFDTLDEALENFRSLRSGRCGARLVAQVQSPNSV